MAAGPPQRQPTFWEKTKNYSSSAYSSTLRPGFNKVYAQVDRLGPYANRLSNKVGGEAFWPTTLDIESEKAARILRSFCKDGLYDEIEEQEAQRVEDKAARERTLRTGFVPKGKQTVIKKIPAKTIQNAKALVIFTTMRTAWVIGGAGGAGVIVARHPETGEWSPPSGIHMQNFSVGFMGGIDIIDTVLVINTYEALEAFTKIRCTLGTEVGLAAGPYGIGGTVDTEITKKPSPVWSYVKTRGAFAGIGIDGNIVIERTDENARFYGEEVRVADILAGKVRHPPYEQYKVLIDTIRAAQGENVDENLLPKGETPSDMELSAGPIFGIPAEDDPDPFGVKALEAEGFVIREAGTHRKASADAFEFRPSPTSPVYATYRRSMDTALQRKEWRGSQQSLASHLSVDRGTQTDEDEIKSPKSPLGPDSPRRDYAPGRSSPMRETQLASSPLNSPTLNGIAHRKASMASSRHSDDSPDEFSDVESDVEIVTAEAVAARPKAGVVTVPKRLPPALPPRNPGRISQATLPRSTNESLTLDGMDQVSLHEDQPSENKTSSITTDEKKDNDVSNSNRQHTLAAGVQTTEDQFHSIPPSPIASPMEEKPQLRA